MDLFTLSMENKLKETSPLGDRMRPEKLEDFVGQRHLVGEGKFLYRAIKSDRINSMILFGPPGTGKTTLAAIIAKSTNKIFEKISAVTSGVKDIRFVIEKAEENLKVYNKRTILFIDEIHRFNKSQQDALLPFVERGVIILIGATTENPYFEVNKALLSRSMVLELYKLDKGPLLNLVDRALKNESKGLGKYKVDISREAINYLVNACEGDARFLLNSLEISVLSTEEVKGIKHIDVDIIKESMQKKNIRYDKDGEQHYNTISAFIKSMRGSDPQGTIYWLARMLYGGEDPKFIARRIIILAAEDIGNADPNALLIANAAFESVNKIGMPEARIILSQASLYMATAPKSNASYMAIDKALEDIRNEEGKDVPKHLKDAHYQGAKDLNRGLDYKYPHDYENNYIEQVYLPEGYEDKKYYIPSNNGYELEIRRKFETLFDKDI